MNNLIRRRVSQNRKRLVEGRYDLDLTYITDNIIAMGYPADKTIQTIIRNHINHVSKFLRERHQNSYKIFNLCAESDYDFNYFQNMVEVIPFEDHNPPKFLQICEFCAKADSWLKEKFGNVIIVHCKAGKGRTGTMISCYLIHSKLSSTPFIAMREFEKKRTKDLRGVTIPSQRRYVEYYGDFLKNNRVYKDLEIQILSIVISQVPNFDSKHLSLQIHKKDQDKKLYDSRLVKVGSNEGNIFRFNISDSNSITGDIKIIFLNKTKDVLFSVTFNTFCSFNLPHDNEYALDENSYQGRKHIDNNNNIIWTLTRDQIDGAPKSKHLDSSCKMEFKINVVNRASDQIALSDPVEIPLNEFNRISTYDNVDDNILSNNSMMKIPHDNIIKEGEEDISKTNDFNDQNNNGTKISQFLARIVKKKKRKKSIYKANILNSRIFGM